MNKITDDSVKVIIILLVISLFSGLFSVSQQTDGLWLANYMQSLSTELLGAIFTFILFEIFIGRRRDSNVEKKRLMVEKRRLMVEMRSQNNDVANNAVRQMRSRGWLSDGSLKDCNLRNANLRHVNFAEADLRGVNFYNANIRRANFYNVYFDETTIMPDGIPWSTEIDLRRYLVYEHGKVEEVVQDIEEYFETAIEKIKSNDKNTGAYMLRKLLGEPIDNRRRVVAYIWLAETSDSKQFKIDMHNLALQLDPNNEILRERLQGLRPTINNLTRPDSQPFQMLNPHV